MLVAVVVDVSAAFLRREGLNAVADAAALAATDGLQGDLAYRSGLDDHVELDVVAARSYVADHLRTTGAAVRFPGLTWSVAVAGGSVLVRVRAPLDLPLRLPGSGSDVMVGATAAAVVVVTEY
jgi:Flp pilus assembly protein TadG